MSAEKGGRVPDFFIVGHAKSGTTALYEMLRRHPHVYMPELKEPWFFATDMKPRFRPPRMGTGPRDLDEYLALFAGAGPDQVAGEASSSYLWSQTAAAGIHEVAPRARVVAILREPASFLRSLHLQLLQNGVESEQDFRRAIELEPERAAGRRIPRRSYRPQLLQYTPLTAYTDQLRRYHDRFGREQVLVLIYEEFRADNEAGVRATLAHFGVDETLPVAVLEVNPSVRVRSQGLQEVLHAVTVGRNPAARAAKVAMKTVMPTQLRREALELARRRVVHGRVRPEDKDFTAQLRRRFAPEVERLSEYLGRDLVSLWAYDELG